MQYIDTAIEAAFSAGKEIMKVYEKADDEREIEKKADNSPLTLADRKAHETIVGFLKNTPLPILSEEGKNIPYNERKNWDAFWMVDPLDGTKEFIKRNGEFTVNIALIENNQPTWGVVYAPVLGQLFAVDQHGKGFLMEHGVKTFLPEIEAPFDKTRNGLSVVASRSHLNDETQEFLSELKDPEIVSMGSSLKFMMLALGRADVYPRFAPTMEWDTAAAHAILKATGRNVYQMSGEELEYNKENLLNPWFMAR